MTETIMLFVFFIVPLAILWVALVIDLVRRSDISLPKKIGWGLFTFATAEFGALVYIAMRPIRYPEDGLTPGSLNETAERLLNASENGGSDDLTLEKRSALGAMR